MSWYSEYLKVYGESFDEGRFHEIIKEVKTGLARLQSDRPVATVSVIAYNEEKHLLACLWSLSRLQSKYPLEIIGVDNDSKDKTSRIFEACGIPYFKETQHSCGFARACGLKHAKGKYHINIDADTMYPPLYAEKMIAELEKKGVVAVSSLWSYMPDREHSRTGLKFYELSRDIYLYLQSFKRPELSVRGLVFAYDTGLARKVGIRTDIIRGEDGSLAFGLKPYGKIKFLRNRKARAVTGYGTVSADGSFLNSFLRRAKKGILQAGGFFRGKAKYEDEDTNLIK